MVTSISQLLFRRSRPRCPAATPPTPPWRPLKGLWRPGTPSRCLALRHTRRAAGGGISRTKPLVLAVSTREKRERGKRELRESREGGRGSENRRREVCRQASLGLESLSFFLRFFSSASLSRDDSPPLSALTSFLFLPSLLAPLSILTSKKQKTRTKKGHGRDGRARRRERPGAHRGRRGREGLQVHFYAALWTSVKWWGQHVLISRCPSHAALS